MAGFGRESGLGVGRVWEAGRARAHDEQGQATDQGDQCNQL